MRRTRHETNRERAAANRAVRENLAGPRPPERPGYRLYAKSGNYLPGSRPRYIWVYAKLRPGETSLRSVHFKADVEDLERYRAAARRLFPHAERSLSMFLRFAADDCVARVESGALRSTNQAEGDSK